MSRQRRAVRPFLFLAVVLVGALSASCGSSTKTTSRPAGPTAVSSTGAGPGTGRGTGGVPAGAAPSTPHTKTGTGALQTVPSSPASKAKPTKEPQTVSAKARFPAQVQEEFLSICETAKGSRATCECIIVKQELRKREKGQEIATLFVLQVDMGKGITLPEAMTGKVLLPKSVHEDLAACSTTT